MSTTLVASAGVKLSVSIPQVDVEFIDAYAASHGESSRSAVLQKALTLLRQDELGDQYQAAWEEWDASDGPLWSVTETDRPG